MSRRILAVVLTSLTLSTIGASAASAASAAPDPVGTVRDIVDFIASCQPGPNGTVYCHG